MTQVDEVWLVLSWHAKQCQTVEELEKINDKQLLNLQSFSDRLGAADTSCKHAFFFLWIGNFQNNI